MNPQNIITPPRASNSSSCIPSSSPSPPPVSAPQKSRLHNGANPQPVGFACCTSARSGGTSRSEMRGSFGRFALRAECTCAAILRRISLPVYAPHRTAAAATAGAGAGAATTNPKPKHTAPATPRIESPPSKRMDRSETTRAEEGRQAFSLEFFFFGPAIEREGIHSVARCAR